MQESDLKTVSTTDLLKFVSTIMPKDYALSVKPEVNYISSVPREEDQLPPPEVPIELTSEAQVDPPENAQSTDEQTLSDTRPIPSEEPIADDIKQELPVSEVSVS